MSIVYDLEIVFHCCAEIIHFEHNIIVLKTLLQRIEFDKVIIPMTISLWHSIFSQCDETEYLSSA